MQAADQAEDVLREHERSKEQLCQELHLLVHQSATAELNKLEQLTKQLDQLNGYTVCAACITLALSVHALLMRSRITQACCCLQCGC